MSGPGSDDSSDGFGDSDDWDRRESSTSDHDDQRRPSSRRDGRETTDEADSGGFGDRSGRPDADSERRASDEPGRERRSDADRPRDARSTSSSRPVTVEDDGVFRWFLRSNDGTVVAMRDVLSSVAIVLLVGLVLFGVSGVWPPLVAVESGSMEPHMERGDLVFVVDETRFVGDEPIDGTGVVTYDAGATAGYEQFGNPGDVIIFKPDGSESQTPIIHRAHFWVDKDENWVETKANPEYTGGATCAELRTCPAPYAGFVTKGDNNPGYDQAPGGAGKGIVKPEWITGKAMFRIPWLGHVRLAFDQTLTMQTLTTSPDAGAASTPGLSPAPDGIEIGLVGVASALAVAGSRRPGSW